MLESLLKIKDYHFYKDNQSNYIILSKNEIDSISKALQIVIKIFNEFFDNPFEIENSKIRNVKDNDYYSVVLFSEHEILINEIDLSGDCS